MKRKIFLLLPFLLLAITKCEEPKKERRNSGRKKVKIEKRPSKLYRMMQIGAVAVPSIIFLVIVCMIYRSKKNKKKGSTLSLEDSDKRKKNNTAPLEGLQSNKKNKDVSQFTSQNYTYKSLVSQFDEENKAEEITTFFEYCKNNIFACVALSLQVNKEKYLFARDKNQNTPLHIAAEEGHLGVVKKLLAVIGEEEDKRKYLKAINNNGDTPLKMVKNALKEEIKVFNAKSEDERRNTRSKIERRKEVVKYLEDYIQKIENPEKQDEKERAS